MVIIYFISYLFIVIFICWKLFFECSKSNSCWWGKSTTTSITIRSPYEAATVFPSSLFYHLFLVFWLAALYLHFHLLFLQWQQPQFSSTVQHLNYMATDSLLLGTFRVFLFCISESLRPWSPSWPKRNSLYFWTLADFWSFC